MKSYRHRSVSGFTLVELLVVIAIIGILVALLLPAIQAAREAARRSECMNHLKQLGVAAQTYHDAKKHFPPGRNGRNEMSVSWAYFILPQIEETAIHDAYDDTVPVYHDNNARTMRTPIAVYACPSRRAPAADRNFDHNQGPPLVLAAASLGDYAANAGLEEDTALEDEDYEDPLTRKIIDISLAGPIYTGSQIKANRVIDGLSKTLAFGEKHIPPVEDDWSEEMVHFEQGDTAFLAGDNIFAILRCSEDGLATSPDDGDDDAIKKFGGPHPGVTMFVFLDGHADGVSNEIDGEALKAMSTIGGEEVIKTN
jgi:prepilin-type N-terminal cleavage/methylation domain-containing protein/prepilin-type processing-associated H-X9-DG protein